jgi:hypothetical protein
MNACASVSLMTQCLPCFCHRALGQTSRRRSTSIGLQANRTNGIQCPPKLHIESYSLRDSPRNTYLRNHASKLSRPSHTIRNSRHRSWSCQWLSPGPAGGSCCRSLFRLRSGQRASWMIRRTSWPAKCRASTTSGGGGALLGFGAPDGNLIGGFAPSLQPISARQHRRDAASLAQFAHSDDVEPMPDTLPGLRLCSRLTPHGRLLIEPMIDAPELGPRTCAWATMQC